VSFQEAVVQRLQLGQKRRREEEQAGESLALEEAFRREDDAGDPQTHASKRQKMRAALVERHAADTQQMQAEHQEVLDNPAAVLAVASAALNEEDRERVERVAQQRRRIAADEEREGVGSSTTARARGQGQETLHAQEGADRLQGVEEGDEGGVEEALLQVALLVSLGQEKSADTLQGGEEGGEGRLEGELLQQAGAGQTTKKRQGRKSQKQLDADESALLQSQGAAAESGRDLTQVKRKGPRSSRRPQEDEQGHDDNTWGQAELQSLGKKNKGGGNAFCEHKRRRYSL
jgi:hypothetical protein